MKNWLEQESEKECDAGGDEGRLPPETTTIIF